MIYRIYRPFGLVVRHFDFDVYSVTFSMVEIIWTATRYYTVFLASPSILPVLTVLAT